MGLPFARGSQHSNLTGQTEQLEDGEAPVERNIFRVADFRSGSISTETDYLGDVGFAPDSDGTADIAGGPFRAITGNAVIRRCSMVSWVSVKNYHAIAIDFATERTLWRNSSATGLKVRFLKVKIATGRV